jgi:4-diphosphocytidyl-2-C-methyl-D-erythritol kinase
VTGRRDDGYHDLESLTVFADCGDRLRFARADGLELALEGPFAPALAAEADNLVLRAAALLAAETGRPPTARITLEKNLPVAAGIGGGSADAAAALRGLVRLWDLKLAPADLMPLARRLGADVPVCLAGRAVRMRGIGDRLEPVSLPFALPLLLVNPGTALATGRVFRALNGRFSAPRDGVPGTDDPDRFLGRLAAGRNDLEAPAIRLAPAIGEVLAALRAAPGCRLARMSGSGATCFGLFADRATRDRAAAEIDHHHPAWWIEATFAAN